MALPLDGAFAGTTAKIADVQVKYNDCITLFPEIGVQLGIVSANVAGIYNQSITMISAEMSALLEQYGINCASRSYFGQEADDLITDKYDIFEKMQSGDIYTPIDDQLDDMLAQVSPIDCSIPAVEAWVRALFDDLSITTDGRSDLINTIQGYLPTLSNFFGDVNLSLGFIGEWMGCGAQMFGNFYDLGPAMDTYNTYADKSFTAIDNAKQITSNPSEIYDLSVAETKQTLGLQTRMDDLTSEAGTILGQF